MLGAVVSRRGNGAPRSTRRESVGYREGRPASGISRPVVGDLRLTLASGAYLDPLNQVSADALVGGDYAFFGQPIVIYQGGPDLDWEDWAVLLDGYMGHPSPTTLPFYGKDEAVFQIQVPPNVYTPPEAT